MSWYTDYTNSQVQRMQDWENHYRGRGDNAWAGYNSVSADNSYSSDAEKASAQMTAFLGGAEADKYLTPAARKAMIAKAPEAAMMFRMQALTDPNAAKDAQAMTTPLNLGHLMNWAGAGPSNNPGLAGWGGFTPAQAQDREKRFMDVLKQAQPGYSGPNTLPKESLALLQNMSEADVMNYYLTLLRYNLSPSNYNMVKDYLGEAASQRATLPTELQGTIYEWLNGSKGRTSLDPFGSSNAFTRWR